MSVAISKVTPIGLITFDATDAVDLQELAANLSEINTTVLVLRLLSFLGAPGGGLAGLAEADDPAGVPGLMTYASISRWIHRGNLGCSSLRTTPATVHRGAVVRIEDYE